MKMLKFALAALALILVMGSNPAFAQSQLPQTTFSVAVTVTDRSVTVSSATSIVAGGVLYADHEAMVVASSYSSGTVVPVQRGRNGTAPAAHNTSAVVFKGTPDQFYQSDPPLGACTVTDFPNQPVINVLTGDVWLCRSSKWKATNVQPIVYDSLTVTP